MNVGSGGESNHLLGHQFANRMNERLQGIEVFIAAVEAGGFARAAARLHLTRSAVTAPRASNA